jgi:ubiquinone/menaquinone biosynthesis C-methylase UbiE
MASGIARNYFEFLANLGITKHPGSMEATRKLVSYCQIKPGDLVLDVGCGVGATPSYLAQEVGCGVVGIDLLHAMIVKARRRVQDDGVVDRVQFQVADARHLPFADGQFDAVISESVNVFFEDKGAALREYMRVARQGGCVGLSETTWLGEPSPELELYFKRVVYAEALDVEGWKALLEEEGLVEVVGSVHPIDIPQESRGRIERYGYRRVVRPFFAMLGMLITDRNARQFMQGGVGGISRKVLDQMGYGVFAGQKR